MILAVCFSHHLLARSCQPPPLAPRKTRDAFARDLIKHRIHFLGDELLRAHRPIAFRFRATLMQRALQNRGPAEAQKMRVKPARYAAAEKSTVRHRRATIEHQAED